MKSLIIYMSIHKGNTEKVAKAMAKILNARLAKPMDIKSEEIKKYDLIGVGSGIYAGRHHKKILDIADNISNKDVFIFSTAGIVSMKNVWHTALRKRLKNNGCKILAEFSCSGFDTVGPFKLFGGLNRGRPNEKDLKNAEDFAKKLKP